MGYHGMKNFRKVFGGGGSEIFILLVGGGVIFLAGPRNFEGNFKIA